MERPRFEFTFRQSRNGRKVKTTNIIIKIETIELLSWVPEPQKKNNKRRKENEVPEPQKNGTQGIELCT